MRIQALVVAAAMLLAAPAFAQVEPLPPPASEGGGAVAEPETPATSEETAPAGGESETPAAVAEAEPELVCRTVTARTESRLRSSRQRVCKTQAEWDAQESAQNRSR